MTLLVGDATIYTVANANSAGTIEAYQFTAAATGTVDTLQFRTSAVANTGMTSLILGIYANNGTAPVQALPLGSGTFSGVPPINTWVAVSGLSIAVTSGTIYWLAALAIGNTVHNFYAVASGGTRISDTIAATHTSLDAIADGWGAPIAQGPIGFQGLSTNSDLLIGSAAESMVTSESAPHPDAPKLIGAIN